MKKPILKKKELFTLLTEFVFTAAAIVIGVSICSGAKAKRNEIEKQPVVTSEQLVEYKEAMKNDALGKTIAIGLGGLSALATGVTVATLAATRKMENEEFFSL